MAYSSVAGGPGLEREWTPSLFSCCEGGIGNCLFVCFCSHCAAGDVAKASGGSYLLDCCGPIIVPPAMPCIWGATRSRVRARLGFKGDMLGDICVMTCCPCCGIIQEMNALERAAILDAERAAAMGQG
jgi:Cys-rich protein (TIGR01571 family)